MGSDLMVDLICMPFVIYVLAYYYYVILIVVIVSGSIATIDRLDHESDLIEIDYKVFLVKNWSV